MSIQRTVRVGQALVAALRREISLAKVSQFGAQSMSNHTVNQLRTFSGAAAQIAADIGSPTGTSPKKGPAPKAVQDPALAAEINKWKQPISITKSEFSESRALDFATIKAKFPEWQGPYAPHRVTPTHTFEEYVEAYGGLESGARLEDVPHITLCGRVVRRRDASSKLYFIDFEGMSSSAPVFTPITLQIICSEQRLSPLAHAVAKAIRQGDWIAVKGFPGKSKTGELSILMTDVTLLSPCVSPIPQQLEDPNTRFRHRHLDLIVNQKRTLPIFRARAQIYAALRAALNARGFVEVETPILWTQAGGATARPFWTNSNAFGEDFHLALRIAPELFLKQLVVGGLHKVYEIGKVFRNEGIDSTHNPEFTSCELYQAHADYNDMMKFTEDVLRSIVHEVTGGSLKITIDLPAEAAMSSEASEDRVKTAHQSLTINFEPDFQRIDVVPALTSMGVRLPENFNDPAAVPELLVEVRRHGIQVSEPYTNGRLFDALIGHFIEPLCVQPTFIMNHPICLSPLAKRSTADPRLTERFELFINKKEYCNAYSELNSPLEQLSRLKAQQRDRAPDIGDVEAHPLDVDYCESLEYGLPPTAGWGLGLDRFVMLLTNSLHIRDVLYFPIMKPQAKERRNLEEITFNAETDYTAWHVHAKSKPVETGTQQSTEST